MTKNNDSFKQILTDNLLLIIILALAAYLRFNNFSNRIQMGFDSARDAFVSLEGAKMFQFPLTGPFIPWYWIQLILARFVIPSAFAPWLLIAIYSLLMVVVMYFIGKRLAGKRMGLIVAFLTALSVNQIDNA